MSNINKQAREKLKLAAVKAVDNFDPNMFVETRDVLALLDELEDAEALNKHLELAIRKAEGCSEALRRKTEAAEKRIAELEAREIALPPRAPENLGACLDGYDKWVIATTFRDTWNACLAEVVRANAAGIITKVGE